jgi:hypothetical protein
MNDVVLNTKKIKRFLPADEGHYNQDRQYSTDVSTNQPINQPGTNPTQLIF